MTHTILYFQSYKSTAKWMNHYKSTASQYMHWSRRAATKVAAVALLLPINIQPYHYQHTNTYQSTLHKPTTTIHEHNTSTHTEPYKYTATTTQLKSKQYQSKKKTESETSTKGAKASRISSMQRSCGLHCLSSIIPRQLASKLIATPSTAKVFHIIGAAEGN